MFTYYHVRLFKYCEKRTKPPNHPLCCHMYGKGHDEDQGAQELSEKEVMVKVIWFKTSTSINPKKSTSIIQAKKLIFVERELLCLRRCFSVSLIPVLIWSTFATKLESLSLVCNFAFCWIRIHMSWQFPSGKVKIPWNPGWNVLRALFREAII